MLLLVWLFPPLHCALCLRPKCTLLTAPWFVPLFVSFPPVVEAATFADVATTAPFSQRRHGRWGIRVCPAVLSYVLIVSVLISVTHWASRTRRQGHLGHLGYLSCCTSQQLDASMPQACHHKARHLSAAQLHADPSTAPSLQQI